MTSVTGGPAGNLSYTYDANGNQTGGDGRTLTYTSFNKPFTVAKGSTQNKYDYDAGHNRIRKVSVKGSETTTTFYLGKAFEQVHKNGQIENKHYIGAGGTTILYTQRSSGTNDTRYLHKDHIGSTHTITNESGNVIENNSFDPWGQRRNPNWTDATTTITSLTTRGFTGHEHDDEIGLVNMNARMYDARLGRFLQPDTYVQFPDSTQGMNRYTYVNNNPLSFTDPSGHFLKGLMRGVQKFFKKWFRTIFSIAIATFMPIALTTGFGGITGLFGVSKIGFVAARVVAGAVSGAVTGGAKGAWGGALSGLMFAGIHISKISGFAKIVAHGIAGGIGSKVGGGSFKEGFISGAGTQAFSQSPLGTYLKDNRGLLANGIAGAIAGGTSAVIGGGKFANGAITGVFSRMFNDVSQKETLSEIRKLMASSKEADKNRAIRLVIKYFNIDMHKYKSISFMKGGKSGEFGSHLNGRIRIYDSAFRSVGWLASTIYHEVVHVRQWSEQRIYPAGTPARAFNEYEAWSKELTQAKRFGLTKSEIAESRGYARGYYNKLTPRLRKLADEGRFIMLNKLD